MSSTSLLSSRRFLPLMLTQFLGTLNDHFFKTAVVMLMTYRTADLLKTDPMNLVALSGTFFILPYTLFCATGGKLADKFDKAQIARIIKLFEVFFMLLATIGLYFHLLGFLFVVLFFMGTHSAFFSPVKYALLPEHLRSEELMQGNAFMEGCTFIAILIGTMAGGVLLLRPHGELIVSGSLMAIALAGVLCSRWIPAAATCDPTVRINFNVLRETARSLSYMAHRRALFKSSLFNSWFWFVCVAFMSLFALYTRKNIGADEDVATVFLTVFAVGIGLGTVACGIALQGRLSVRTVPMAAVAMSLFILDLYWVSPHAAPQGALITITQFIGHPRGWRMAFDLFMIAFSGGFYIVPLYTALQQMCEPHHRAQTMACNNVMNAFFMMISALSALIMCQFGYSVADVFLVNGIFTALVAVALYTPAGKLLPDE